MKTTIYTFFLVLMMTGSVLMAQTEYFYPLKNDFLGVQPQAPALVQIPNNNGLTGQFTTRPIPASLCGSAGTAPGYTFEDDSGLQFNDPTGFIDQAYSLAMNFAIDEFVSPSWVRLLSFTHTDDVGIYIKLTNPPINGTLEFWPNGTVGQWDFFTPGTFYQLILVRNTAGTITIYVNGQEFATYDDSATQAYVPVEPTNYIIFFRDDPSVLANEASPGFVSSIRINNQTWTPAQVQTYWDQFCSSLQGIGDNQPESYRIYPNPVSEVMTLHRMQAGEVPYRIYAITGTVIRQGIINGKDATLSTGELHPGIYWLRLEEENGPVILKFIRR